MTYEQIKQNAEEYASSMYDKKFKVNFGKSAI